ncbi:type 2 lantipeptide synthetase LanM family protein [Natronosporangium hydrolyticum]|uniref:Type 2 lantipeptide synthetase LanM family protein n=2 Tax=Natronosporangium hydrolyticum TaxID=2811111 RepID=A0A895YHJ6_9ACTN|nr:type 2 lantipeptide synthetase LanM family protein [Natronosporangium hydrolyticum]
MLSRLVEPPLATLAAQLRSLGTLSEPEQQVLIAGVRDGLTQVAWRRVSRVVLLELNAARVTGQLTADDADGRWREWVARLAEPDGWERVAAPYPPLLPQLWTLIGNRCAAALRMADRFGRDRGRLGQLVGGALGELQAISTDAGDSHRGGESVTILRCTGGSVVYKPRSVRVDAALDRFLRQVLPDEPEPSRIRVPAVLPSPEDRYGWAEYVPHVYCADQEQLGTFYRNLGHWLAVMRALAGSDLHNENVVACGPVPVVVDCETLFTPPDTSRPSGFGEALDLAAAQTRQSLLRTGLLPGRQALLGWRGVDPSAAGFLPSEQPTVQVPTIADPGTDRARLTLTTGELPASANLPSPEPDLGGYWQAVVGGFSELTEVLHARDAHGELAPLLAEFADCPVRVVVRDTTAYTELGRMLWHPASLHDPPPARRRAAELLVQHAENRPGAPDAAAVVEAEIDELLDGDVPVFTTTPGTGVLTGPRGTTFGEPRDLVAETLHRWRQMRPEAERRVIRAAMVGAYLNDGWRPGQDRLPSVTPRADGLDRRRREQAATIVARIATEAIWGRDGSVTWVAPVRSSAGWAVQPLPTDLYGGGFGVAVVLAGYLREVSQSRADPVPGLTELLAAVVHTIRLAEDQQRRQQADAAALDIRIRPDPPGGYLGIGSRIWGWLLLHQLGVVPGDEARRRASGLAELLPAAAAADREHDLVTGSAGAIVPLLALADQVDAAPADAGAGTDSDSGPRLRALAGQLGDRLQASASRAGAGAGWPTDAYPDGIGGLSHGATGIGWALRRLADATGRAEFAELAEAAFTREASYFDPDEGAWRDAREGKRHGAAWCHGSVGIGIAADDLLGRRGSGRWEGVLRHAAAHAWADGFGWTHTLCHGDLGAWELLARASARGLGPPGVTAELVAARLLTTLEEHGPMSGMARDAFAPGLLAGEGGVAYQLLRLHPECDLPSVLLPVPASPGRPTGRPTGRS